MKNTESCGGKVPTGDSGVIYYAEETYEKRKKDRSAVSEPCDGDNSADADSGICGAVRGTEAAGRSGTGR